MENNIKTLLDKLAEAKEAGDSGAARKIRMKLRKAGYSLRSQNGGAAPKKPPATPEVNTPKKHQAEEAVTLILDFGPDEDVRTLYLAPGCTLTLTLR